MKERKEMRIYYNDLPNHVNSIFGYVIEQDTAFITIEDSKFGKTIQLPLIKIVRIEELRK